MNPIQDILIAYTIIKNEASRIFGGGILSRPPIIEYNDTRYQIFCHNHDKLFVRYASLIRVEDLAKNNLESVLNLYPTSTEELFISWDNTHIRIPIGIFELEEESKKRRCRINSYSWKRITLTKRTQGNYLGTI